MSATHASTVHTVYIDLIPSIFWKPWWSNSCVTVCVIKLPKDRNNLTPLRHTKSIWELHNQCESVFRLSPNIAVCGTARRNQRAAEEFILIHFNHIALNSFHGNIIVCNSKGLTGSWVNEQHKYWRAWWLAAGKKGQYAEKIVMRLFLFSEKKRPKTFLPQHSQLGEKFWPGFNQGTFLLSYWSVRY